MMRNRFACVALLVFAALPLFAADKRIEGSWTATVTLNGQRCIFNTVMGPEQHYTETLQCGSQGTGQSGIYVFENGLLIRTVADFYPRWRYVVDVNPFAPWRPADPPGHYEKNATPPGGTWRVVFNSANTMTWKDLNLGGVVTFHRK